MQKVLGLFVLCFLSVSIKGQETIPPIDDIDITSCGGHIIEEPPPIISNENDIMITSCGGQTTPPKDSNFIYDFVEQSARYPGGDSLMLDFIANNLRYPPLANASCISGRVILLFVVEKDGSLTNIKAVRKLGGGTEEEAIRVVQLMPKWKPAQQNGKVVRQRYTMPIFFRLVD